MTEPNLNPKTRSQALALQDWLNEKLGFNMPCYINGVLFDLVDEAGFGPTKEPVISGAYGLWQFCD
jgi:subtilase family serine protease